MNKFPEKVYYQGAEGVIIGYYIDLIAYYRFGDNIYSYNKTTNSYGLLCLHGDFLDRFKNGFYRGKLINGN